MASASPLFAASEKMEFTRDIRPILSDNCYHCHGPDEQRRKAKLRLDSKEGLFAVREGKAVIKAGSPQSSELWRRITTQDLDDLMPPLDSHKKLTPEQIAKVKAWIEQGAPFQTHWAFEPVARPAAPKTKAASWARTGLDPFILAKLEAARLAPSPEADRQTLIRRLSLDLTGLPPTPREVDDFLADKSADAYERLVDRLLASPRYGEHMARAWLDAARYADTHGLHLDNERSMWPYRDWVVNAFNRNLPFDQFTIEQLAGDLLPGATVDQKVASGFNRCNVTTSEGGSIGEEFIFRYAVDRTETTAAVWLGLTAGCAVCHDHKFDPISQKEFYSLFAFFNSAADPAMDGNILLTPPVIKLSTPEQQRKLDGFTAALAVLEKQAKERLATLKYEAPDTGTNAVKITETIWVEDDFPAGAKAAANADTAPTTWIDAGKGLVHSGKRALQRKADGIAQDFFTGASQPLTPTATGKFFAHVYLDPANLPKAIMLQFHTDSWRHRANWGDDNAINYGVKNTPEKMLMGKLPEAGKWVRLEVPAAKLGIKPGTKITGMAFTQYGGTVHWDTAGLSDSNNPADNPALSILAWEKSVDKKTLPRPVQDALKPAADKRTDAHRRAIEEHYLQFAWEKSKGQFTDLNEKLKKAKEEQDAFDKAVPSTLVMADLPTKRDAFIHLRGQYNKLGEKVERGVPAILPPLAKSTNTPTRLDLARWLVTPGHPLTARVAVNRFWQQFFGTGLVKTSADFGAQGEPPSHPELLDWLAGTWIEQGWDVKRLVKLMVSSAAYRQESKVLAKALAADPENRLYARGPRFRLDAETLRDNALFVSGLLVEKLGGKGVRPYQPENIWEPVGFGGSNTRNYVQDHGEALYRRSLYTFLKRTAPPPFMASFDAPNREQTCVRRERSNTPLQALQLLNDIQHVEAARQFAQRLISEGGDKAESRLDLGFRVATSRRPTPAEQKILKASLDKQLARYQKDKEAAEKLVKYGEAPAKPGLDPVELAAYTMVANLLLNLDEVVTKN
jgi:hypothetical protein